MRWGAAAFHTVYVVIDKVRPTSARGSRRAELHTGLGAEADAAARASKDQLWTASSKNCRRFAAASANLSL